MQHFCIVHPEEDFDRFNYKEVFQLIVSIRQGQTFFQVMLALNGVRAEVNLALIRSLKSLHVENNIKWPDKI
jgi:hypothetical protein